jgi:hypothetical protein
MFVQMAKLGTSTTLGVDMKYWYEVEDLVRRVWIEINGLLQICAKNTNVP